MGHKKLRIVVKAFEDGSGGHRFEMWDASNNQITDETIEFEKPLHGNGKMKKVDHHRVTFALENQGNADLKFANAENAFMIDIDGGTPDKGKHLDAFWVDARPDDRTIEVINMNLKEQRYKFTLNFLPSTATDNGGPYVEYDPIGDNKNGGAPGSEGFFAYIAPITLGVLAGLAAFAAARLFLTGW